jgi:predicted small secreted protein
MKRDHFIMAISSSLAIGIMVVISVSKDRIRQLENENKNLLRKYEVVCGSLNDCCRNMIDAYNLPDSIYNNYLDVIEEQGYDKLEVKHLYFSY